MPQAQPTQAVAQVDQVQKITVSTNGAQEFGATDMARVSRAMNARGVHVVCVFVLCASMLAARGWLPSLQ